MLSISESESRVMSSTTHTAVEVLAEAATLIGARPFKDTTGNWSSAVEIAVMDTVLSTGAKINGVYGAGVLPRLRAYKAYRGPANMMRLLATLGPFVLDDFVAEHSQITTLMNAAAALHDAGVQTAADVDADSADQRDALRNVPGMPALSWDYFLVNLGVSQHGVEELKNTWLNAFVQRTLAQDELPQDQRDVLLAHVTEQLNAEHQRKSFGYMPEFTIPQLHQAIYRSEYARATKK